MASLGPQTRNHVYVIIRLNMSKHVYGIVGSMFCHYGETDDAFLIGGLVEPNETMMASAIRDCRQLVNLCLKPNHRLYLTNIINALIDHEPSSENTYLCY